MVKKDRKTKTLRKMKSLDESGKLDKEKVSMQLLRQQFEARMMVMKAHTHSVQSNRDPSYVSRSTYRRSTKQSRREVKEYERLQRRKQVRAHHTPTPPHTDRTLTPTHPFLTMSR
jgi:hypothetical protein